jgi:hypothetical protein
MPTPPTKDHFLLHVAGLSTGMLVHKVLIGCMAAHNYTLNMVESDPPGFSRPGVRVRSLPRSRRLEVNLAKLQIESRSRNSVFLALLTAKGINELPL